MVEGDAFYFAEGGLFDVVEEFGKFFREIGADFAEVGEGAELVQEFDDVGVGDDLWFVGGGEQVDGFLEEKMKVFVCLFFLD